MVKQPAALIINLDKSYNPGTHWVAVVINQDKSASYFDSLGRKPPKAIENFLRRNSNVHFFNNIQYQHNDSLHCALFCIVYIYYAVREINILPKFHTKDLKKNDTIVKNYIRKIVNRKQKCI
jgi:hypothetical protein